MTHLIVQTHPLVRWIDPDDGGWKMGTVIFLENLWVARIGEGGQVRLLIQHDHTRKLEFVQMSLLEIAPYRDGDGFLPIMPKPFNPCSPYDDPDY